MDRPGIEEAARALVAKLDAVDADPQFQSFFGLAYVRTGVQYSGPSYGEELAALKGALAPPPAPADPVAEIVAALRRGDGNLAGLSVPERADLAAWVERGDWRSPATPATEAGDGRPFHPAPARPELEALIERAKKIPITPEMRDQQRRSWVRGEMMLENPNLTPDEVDAMLDRSGIGADPASPSSTEAGDGRS